MGMVQSAQAAVTEHHRLGGLDNGLACLKVLYAGKSNIKMPAKRSVYGENSLPGLQTASFSLCPCVVETDRMLSGATNPVTEDLTLMTLVNLNYLSPYMSYLQMQSHQGARASKYEFWGA